MKKTIDSIEKIINGNKNIIRYIKNYSGDLIRKGKTISSYKFYDEREWRYIPAWNNDKLAPFLNASEYKKYRGTSKTKPLIPEPILSFTSTDIKYLIVKSNKDIPKLIKFISHTENLTKTPNDADILATKILTVEQLNNDF